MITAEHLHAASAVVGRLGPGDGALAQLREQWPMLRFVACSDDDMPPQLSPASEGDGYALYLIAGDQHCLSLTGDPTVAIGLVLAAVNTADRA